jgi:phosphoribosyl 1,2-cyclic phosphate phosphodiesterase
MAAIRGRFPYVFQAVPEGEIYYKPVLRPHPIEGGFRIGAIAVEPFQQDHGWSKTLGLRFGRFGYSTDAQHLDDAAFAALAGIDTWVVDCVREEPHPTHSHLEQTLGWIDRLKPRRAILTHMGTQLDYDRLRAVLPPGVEPGYDGMVLEL